MLIDWLEAVETTLNIFVDSVVLLLVIDLINTMKSNPSIYLFFLIILYVILLLSIIINIYEIWEARKYPSLKLILKDVDTSKKLTVLTLIFAVITILFVLSLLTLNNTQLHAFITLFLLVTVSVYISITKKPHPK